ncbi:hypothetical protein K470DRAFT_265890 [Piedraia hortae CBS 480.64]|uniref:Uncharacterized protein n=1 Tax=Piedraia hortae CBS 480.64 TaxID=1314780 RepID=A0A6A7BU08_9PEZI|nr:hypothetical protein K470DRAFT_265890 [Piedraia hortae CBS 480.64]
MSQTSSQPRPYSQVAYQSTNGAQLATAESMPEKGIRTLDASHGRVHQVGRARVLCIADVRGSLTQLNELARNAKANYIIHTGDFGFYDESSLERIAEKTLKHVAQYSPLLSEPVKADVFRSASQESIKDRFQREHLPLSELPQFLNKTYKLEVPVYTVWGACEDVLVLEKLRSGEYKVDNLHVIDESHSRLLDIGGVRLRLLGLGGAVVMHKMFDNGEGRTTIAGGQGTMWTTFLQIGELLDTANRVYDPTETRVFITHASPAREGLLNQLSVALKADFSISAGLHFRYGSSYNEFSVNPSLDYYRGKLAQSKSQFNDVWETVKNEVEQAVTENESQNRLLQQALDLVGKMPVTASGGNPFGGGPPNGQVDESAFKNTWNFNLADAAFGWLVLDIDQGRVGTEMRAQGFNFSHRLSKVQQRPQPATSAPSNSSMVSSSRNAAPVVDMASLPSRPVPHGSTQQQPADMPPPFQAVQPSIAQKQFQNAVQPKSAPQQQQQQPAANVQKTASPPATNQTALTANGTTAPTAALPQANGTPTNETQKQGEGQKASQPPREPSKGIFIYAPQEIATVENVKELFSAEDAAKIERVDKLNNGRWVAHFGDHDTMSAVLKNGLASEAREKYTKQGNSQVRMSELRSGNRFNSGHWGRGGGHRSGGERQGYQSTAGNTGSESDTNRHGRGRGRGGGFRGDRNRNRGGRGNDRSKPDAATGNSSTPATGGGES